MGNGIPCRYQGNALSVSLVFEKQKEGFFMKMKHIVASLALLAMPFTAQAEVREAGLVDGFGMNLIYPAVHTKNVAAENAINKDIRGYVRRMKDLYENGEKQEVYMTYTTKYEDDDLVSIVLETSTVNEGMADRNANAYGLVYDKKTGDLLDKSKFGVKVDSGEIVNLLKKGKLELYNINGKKLSYDSVFKPSASMEAECFLLGKKELGLLYAAGELAPYSEGATYVVIHLK